MSEHYASFVDLDVAVGASRQLMDEVASWLVADRIVVPGSMIVVDYLPGARPHPSCEWKVDRDICDCDRLFGPRERPPQPGRYEAHDNLHTVRMYPHRMIAIATESFEPPPCPSCGVDISTESYYDLMTDWLNGPEPMLECPVCGSAHLIGDWQSPTSSANAVGNLLVEFDRVHGGAFLDSFITDIGRHLSRRWSLVYTFS